MMKTIVPQIDFFSMPSLKGASIVPCLTSNVLHGDGARCGQLSWHAKCLIAQLLIDQGS